MKKKTNLKENLKWSKDVQSGTWTIQRLFKLKFFKEK